MERVKPMALCAHTLNSYLPGEHAIPFDVHIVVNCEDSMYSKLDIHRLTSSRDFEVQRLFLALLDWSQVASYFSSIADRYLIDVFVTTVVQTKKGAQQC